MRIPNLLVLFVFVPILAIILLLVNLLLSLNNINADMNIIQLIQLEILGYSLYTYYAVLLIILGFILLLGMFSAIILSKKDE